MRRFSWESRCIRRASWASSSRRCCTSARCVPNLSFAADAHYHHLEDDVIEGGKFKYENGAIRVPDAPGLGVRLDRDKLAKYEEHYRRLGSYPYDQDPGRPGWTPLIPNDRWADPPDDREPFCESR